MTLAEGTRVRLRQDEERWPHFIAPKGATGTVIDVGAPSQIALAVRLDEPLEGAEMWSNEVHWMVDFIDHDPIDDVEVITHMSEDEFENLLYKVLLGASDSDMILDEEYPLMSVLPFQEAGLMTTNKGVVVTTIAGDEFEVSITRRH